MFKYLIFALNILLFMACSSDNSGKISTSSGYDVKIHGNANPTKVKPGDYVYFLVDILNDKDELIQSLRNAPETPVIQLPSDDQNMIKSNPVMEALSLVGVGDSLSVFIPRDSIPTRSPLMENTEYVKYNIVVLETIDQATYAQRLETSKLEEQEKMVAIKASEGEKAERGLELLNQLNAGALDNDIIIDSTGLKYVILKEGQGPIAKSGQMVETSYYGFLRNGNSFDNSYKRGMSYPVQLGTNGVIRGWEIGLSKLNSGTEALFIIPYELGYGEAGSPPLIPEKSELIFYIEVGEIFY